MDIEEAIKAHSYQGKIFDCEKDMWNYALNWPNEKFDLDIYKSFLHARLQEAIEFTTRFPDTSNREVYTLLRNSTDWLTINE